MFDPNIKVRVIADFKYRDESYVVANSHLSFDIYDSMKIAELVNLYNPYYEYRDHLELPSKESLPFHVLEQLIDTYKFDKPVDAAEFLPISDKATYEIGGDTYTPFGYSPYESDIETNVKPLADNVVEVPTYEPKFVEIDAPKPSVAEDKTIEKTSIKPEIVEEEEDLVNNIPLEAVNEEVTNILNLSEEDLNVKSATAIKRALAESYKDYIYTNKTEAIKYILSLK